MEKMEKIPAACAMEWSIELEKGLRSKRTDRIKKVIKQAGHNLQLWSGQPEATLGVTNMYGLVPGEDRIFANTILLRLAEAFRTGDNHIRACILKAFLSELRHSMRRGKAYDGILTKQRVPNYLELLRRVKIVFDTGDVEARGLSLRMFGCWVGLTKDNADVRHMILSSLRSPNVPEVKASLFAAGCICKMSDDFACIILGQLVDIICSGASFAMKLTAAHTFGRMQSSSLIINRAYKVGKKLVLDFPLDEVATEMLFSLSKLAFKSILLWSEQVDFLLSILRHECASFAKPMALKCLRLLLEGHHFPVKWSVSTALYHIINDPSLPVSLQGDALGLLLKVFPSSLQNLSLVDMSEFHMLVSAIESVARSPAMPNSFLALGLLVDLSCNLKKVGRKEWLVAGFAGHVSELAVDRLHLLLRHMDIGTDSLMFDTSFKVKKEYEELLNLVLIHMEDNPELCPMVLTNICSFSKDLVDCHYTTKRETLVRCSYLFNREASDVLGKACLRDLDIQKPSPSYDLSNKAHNDKIASEIIICICRFIISCLNILYNASAATIDVFETLKLFAECILESRFCNYVGFEIFSLQLRSCIMHNSCGMDTDGGCSSDAPKVGAKSSSSDIVHWVHHEYLALQFAKGMRKGKDNWSLYRAAKCFALEGLWLAATFSFKKLVDQVQSEICSFWLRSLMLLAGAESEKKLLLLPKLGVSLISLLHTDNDCKEPWSDVRDRFCETVESVNLHVCGEKVVRIYKKIYSSEEMLAAAGTSYDAFYFQRWFLNLRARALEVLVDVLALLDSNLCNEVHSSNDEFPIQYAGTCNPTFERNLHALTFNLTSISLRLNNLAKEYDLLATSFMDMDLSSSRCISRLALNCSLLAFCAAFPLLFTRSPAYENFLAHEMSHMDISSVSLLIQDLMERLWDIDDTSVMDLRKLMTIFPSHKEYLRSRTHLFMSGLKEKTTIMLCRSVISGIYELHEEAEGAQSYVNLCLIFYKGLNFFSDVVKRWIDLPLRTPRYFFRARPCICTELYTFSANSSASTGITAPPGSHLSLNLCIQLKNMSPETRFKISKVYCILVTTPSDCISSDQKGRAEDQELAAYEFWKSRLTVDLNEKLLVSMNNIELPAGKQNLVVGKDHWVTTYVCFDLNETRQGFSTCLLDVSNFPEGSYRIRCHNCCIDNDGRFWALPCVNRTFFTINKSSIPI